MAAAAGTMVLRSRTARKGVAGIVAAMFFGFVGVTIAAAAVTGQAPAAAAADTTTATAAGTGVGVRTDAGIPAVFLPLLAKYGTSCPQISASLLAAQLETESGWQATALSPAGAYGYAQFMPGTWAAWGRDGDGDGRADPTNPADAVASQAAYDCQLATDTARYPGDRVQLMLAAYNAGLGAVQRAGGIPGFAETQNYVQKIPARARQLETKAVQSAAVTGPLTLTPGGCSSPLPGAMFTQPFHAPSHMGIDLSMTTAPTGGQVRAFTAGVVAKIDDPVSSGGYGNFVQIQHAGFVTAYAHLATVLTRVGQQVAAGQTIGIEGGTGHVTGTHLHFEVRSAVWGTLTDPEITLRACGVKVR